MFLLNSDQIRHTISFEPDHQRLHITNFIQEELKHTFYYFHIGTQVERQQEDGTRVIQHLDFRPRDPHRSEHMIRIAKSEMLWAWTLEKFRTDNRTLGILGPSTDLNELGIVMLHSPFIDPLYPADQEDLIAPLKVGLLNASNADILMKPGERIGKVSFFDVSDTYPLSLKSHPDLIEKHGRRATETE